MPRDGGNPRPKFKDGEHVVGWNTVDLTLAWGDGRQIRVRVGEDLIADTAAFTTYLRTIVNAMNGIGG